MRATGMPLWIVRMTVSTAAAIVGKAQTAAEIAALGRRATHRSLDVADIAAGRAFADLVARDFGAVDILIGAQNAGRLHTNVLIYEIVNTLQMENNPGAAAIMAIVLFLITLGLTLLQMRFLERRVHYAN